MVGLFRPRVSKSPQSRTVEIPQTTVRCTPKAVLKAVLGGQRACARRAKTSERAPARWPTAQATPARGATPAAVSVDRIRLLDLVRLDLRRGQRDQALQ